MIKARIKVKGIDHQGQRKVNSLAEYIRDTLATYLDSVEKEPSTVYPLLSAWGVDPAATWYPVKVSDVEVSGQGNMISYDVTFRPVQPVSISVTINKDGSVTYGDQVNT